MNKPSAADQGKSVLPQKKGATERKRSVAPRGPLCIAAQRAVGLKSALSFGSFGNSRLRLW